MTHRIICKPTWHERDDSGNIENDNRHFKQAGTEITEHRYKHRCKNRRWNIIHNRWCQKIIKHPAGHPNESALNEGSFRGAE